MLIKFSELENIRRKHKNQKIIFAGGVFDLLHLGHIDYFKALSNLADIVVIAVSSNKRVKERKGMDRPIISEGNRAILVDAIKSVDYSLVAPKPAKNKPVPTVRILMKLKPDIFAAYDKRWLQWEDEIQQLGAKLKILPRFKKHNSTTRMINRIKKINTKYPN